MSESRKSKYYISDRFIQKLHKDILLNILIILVFFGMFQVVFREHPNYGGIRIALVFIFIVIGIAVILSDVWRIKKYMSIYYEIGEKELIYFDGKRTSRYPWEHFSAVKVNPNRFSLMYPYEFQTTEGKFYLHKQIGSQEELIPAILERARPYAKIDEAIPDVFQASDPLVDKYIRR